MSSAKQYMKDKFPWLTRGRAMAGAFGIALLIVFHLAERSSGDRVGQSSPQFRGRLAARKSKGNCPTL